jgi:hypothetical protein
MIIRILPLLLLVSCATGFVPTYATLKLIERGTVTAEQVVQTLDAVESVLTVGVDIAAIGGIVRDAVGYADLPPSDRYLVDTLLAEAAQRAGLSVGAPLSEDSRLALLQVMGQIRLGAMSY